MVRSKLYSLTFSNGHSGPILWLVNQSRWPSVRHHYVDITVCLARHPALEDYTKLPPFVTCVWSFWDSVCFCFQRKRQKFNFIKFTRILNKALKQACDTTAMWYDVSLGVLSSFKAEYSALSGVSKYNRKQKHGQQSSEVLLHNART